MYVWVEEESENVGEVERKGEATYGTQPGGLLIIQH